MSVHSLMIPPLDVPLCGTDIIVPVGAVLTAPTRMNNTLLLQRGCRNDYGNRST